MASINGESVFSVNFIKSPLTLSLIAILFSVVSIWFVILYLKFQRIVKQIDRIPGPPVSNVLTGHLELFRKTSGRSDWFQRKLKKLIYSLVEIR